MRVKELQESKVEKIIYRPDIDLNGYGGMTYMPYGVSVQISIL